MQTREKDKYEMYEVNTIQNMKDSMKTSRRKSTAGSVLVNLAGRSLLAAAAFALLGAGTAQAEGVVTDRDWINIGDTSNLDDDSGYGAVDYGYRISSIETTVNDWDAFYNDGSSQKVGSFNSNYDVWTDGTYGPNLNDDSPVVNVSMYQAAQYANWLTTGDATDGAYTIDGSGDVTGTIGHDPDSSSMASLISSHGTVYVLPTEDEWYKAAYGNAGATEGDFSVYSDYANGDDVGNPPTKSTDGSTGWNYDSAIGNPWTVDKGTAEQNDTYNMMGNVNEWQEDTGGVLRGGYYHDGADRLRSSLRYTHSGPTSEHYGIGFRVVAIPEPVSGELFVLVVGLLWFVRRRACA